MAEREVILSSVRDLVVLIVLVAFLLWLAYEFTRDQRR
jgi:hypothetical protein